MHRLVVILNACVIFLLNNYTESLITNLCSRKYGFFNFKSRFQTSIRQKLYRHFCLCLSLQKYSVQNYKKKTLNRTRKRTNENQYKNHTHNKYYTG